MLSRVSRDAAAGGRPNCASALWMAKRLMALALCVSWAGPTAAQSVSDTPAVVPLPPASPTPLCVDTNSVSFGEVRVWSVSPPLLPPGPWGAVPSDQRVVISNCAQDGSLLVVSLTFDGSREFRLEDAFGRALVVPQSGEVGTFALAPGALVGLYLRFGPRSVGDKTAILTITGRDIQGQPVPGSPQIVILSGTGAVEPHAALRVPPSTEFGSAAIGTSPASVSRRSLILLQNLSDKPLQVTGTRMTGDAASDFSVIGHLQDGQIVAGNDPFTIPARSEALLVVQFTPTATGDRTAVLSVLTSGGSGTVSLHGLGVVPIAGLTAEQEYVG